MGYKVGYHVLALPNQVLLINSVLTNEVLLCVVRLSGQCTNAYVHTYVPTVAAGICEGPAHPVGPGVAGTGGAVCEHDILDDRGP